MADINDLKNLHAVFCLGKFEWAGNHITHDHCYKPRGITFECSLCDSGYWVEARDSESVRVNWEPKREWVIPVIFGTRFKIMLREFERLKCNPEQRESPEQSEDHKQREKSGESK